MTNRQAFSRFYLTLVPFLAAAIALGLGHSRPQLYLPIWLAHALLMAFAVWRLGKNWFTNPDANQRQLGTIALLIIIPWIGFTVFAGMGPPPTFISEWVETATEQQIRYALLIAGGDADHGWVGLAGEQTPPEWGDVLLVTWGTGLGHRTAFIYGQYGLLG